jgi:hypothetical protein
MQISEEGSENMFVFSSFMIMVLKTNSSKNTSIEKKKKHLSIPFKVDSKLSIFVG